MWDKNHKFSKLVNLWLLSQVLLRRIEHHIDSSDQRLAASKVKTDFLGFKVDSAKSGVINALQHLRLRQKFAPPDLETQPVSDQRLAASKVKTEPARVVYSVPVIGDQRLAASKVKTGLNRKNCDQRLAASKVKTGGKVTGHERG